MKTRKNPKIFNESPLNRVIFKAATLTTRSAVRKIKQRDGSVGLLEFEQFDDQPRPQRYAETAKISQSVFEETPNAVDEPFLRARKRVPVRRRGGASFYSRFSWQSRTIRIVFAIVVLAILGLIIAVLLGGRSFLLHNHRFVLTSTGNIQVDGNSVVNTPQVRAFFDADAGHSVFHVPLVARQQQLQQILWVRRAIVMRLWPNRMRISILERTPVAFARDGNVIRLVDDDGVILDFPKADVPNKNFPVATPPHPAQHYSFPVLTGISAADPLSIRAARLQLYRQFTQALDAEGGQISSTLSEVDLSDPEDVRAMFTGTTRQPLIHFGDSDYLARYRAYRAHLTEWMQQYPQLRSVDMRYGRQVVLDTGNDTPQDVSKQTLKDVELDAVSPAPPSKPSPAAIHETPTVVKTSSPTKPVISTAANATEIKSKPASPKKSASIKHHASAHSHAPKSSHGSSPQRGHPVHNPIMHVVSGN